MTRRLSLLALCALSCAHQPLPVSRPPAAAPAPDENSYLDLAPGSRLRILVPLKKQKGFQMSYYSVEGSGDGKVHLTFLSAETTTKGETVPDPAQPRLSFPLPGNTQFTRLLFLIRVSNSDHNMAIVATDTRDALETITTQVRQNPDTCKTTEHIFCTWVPEGIAVRPQTPDEIPK